MRFTDILNESTPRTLYHGTLRKYLPSILRHGLEPNVGEFTRNAYDELPEDEFEELVFAADKKSLRSCVSAIIGALRHNNIPISVENFFKYGVIVVLKHAGDNFTHKDVWDDDWHPSTAEPGDYYSEYRQRISYVISGKRLLRLLKRNKISTSFLGDIKSVRNISEASAHRFNDAFWNWFRDSKVVDKDGNPLVVYHSTNADFDAFNIFANYDSFGAHFGTIGQANAISNAHAKQFAIQHQYPKNTFPGLRTLPVYLSIQHPIELPDFEYWDLGKLSEFLYNKYKIKINDSTINFSIFDDDELLREQAKIVIHALLRHGFDGAYYLNKHEGDGKSISWIAFKPNQIKSALSNTNFDLNKDAIHEANAYHGSPHSFDEFSIDHIGDGGQGRLTYGWGIYVSKQKSIARRYKKGGTIYHVTIPNEDKMIEWEKPFSQQSAFVQNALNSLGYDAIRQKMIDDEEVAGYEGSYTNDSGEDIYGIITSSMLSPSPVSMHQYMEDKKKTSMLLLKHGILGIKHLDPDSGTKSNDHYNYVIYDPRYITIEKKTKS